MVMLNKHHEHQKHHYDKQSKHLVPTEIGQIKSDSVRFQQDDKTWKPATVLSISLKQDSKLTNLILPILAVA